ncbi:MAG: hypothetical protein NW202_13475 [Nitrospira sp.]|nr:hypothetical protein [Nitrospira sp.]
MPKTVGRNVPRRFVRRGQHVALCDNCGAPYYSDQLVEMEDGTILCHGPGTLDDAKGRVAMTLSRLNAERAGDTNPGEVDSSVRLGRYDRI